MGPRANKGQLLQLQGFSTHDGDGIRTVIFLPGCPLRCHWCANPESWTPAPKLAFYESKCTRCGACRAACPQGIFPAGGQAAAQGCTACGSCICACPQRALALLCHEATAGEILAKIQRDELFFRHSGGGVTFSGGEPTCQQAFLRELAYALYDRGIDMWMETCGEFPFAQVQDILSLMSHVFYDIKCMDDALHRRVTGVPNARILQNAAALHELGIPMTVRMPCIPGVNLTEENLLATAAFLRSHLPRADMELLPYHQLGEDKYRALGLHAQLHTFAVPTAVQLDRAGALLRQEGIAVTSYQ